jgi:hypothetical protein
MPYATGTNDEPAFTIASCVEVCAGLLSRNHPTCRRSNPVPLLILRRRSENAGSIPAASMELRLAGESARDGGNDSLEPLASRIRRGVRHLGSLAQPGVLPLTPEVTPEWR